MPKKKTYQKHNIFYYFGLPLHRILLAATIVASFVFFGIFSLLQSFKFSIAIPKPKLRIVLPKPSLTLSPYLFKISVVIFATSVLSYFCLNFVNTLPDPRSISSYPAKLSTKILDRNGQLLYQIYKDENRTQVSLSSLPDHVKKSFLAAEDKNFYQHFGFSISGLVRAAYRNIFNKKVEGGSTITQQLVKNTLLDNEKTITRKIKELILSLQIETIFTKDQIFETYLNQVGFGGPAYGIQEAARQYFATDAASLTISQSAYLAGLTRAPSFYSPYGNQPNEGLVRQETVLRQMVENKYISQEQYEQSLSQEVTFNSEKTSINAPHFVMYVRDLLTDQLGEKTVSQDGLEITTTLDLDLQNKIQKILLDEVQKLKNLHVTNGAVLVTRPKTGEIITMVGSVNYFNLNNQGQVNLTTALRQPGSSIKPLNYALAFENGKKPDTLIEDKPIIITYPNKEKWVPKNYDNKFHGQVTLRQALGNSYNIPSVLLLKDSDPVNFAKLAKKMGITTWNDPSRYGLSMALGSLEVKMTELATAYSAFANNGISTPLIAITRFNSNKDSALKIQKCNLNAKSLPENTIKTAVANEDECLARRVVSSQTANNITSILSDNQARSSAFGANSVLNIKNSKVAVKTGTSNELRDNWAVGYNQDYLVAVWVGNNDNTPMSKIASGITGASPIWANVFKLLLATKP